MAQTGTTTLKEFGDCLSSREPRLLDLPSEFPMPADPVAWAHDVMSAHPAKLKLEAMPRTVGVRVDDPSKAPSRGQDTAPELVRNMLTGISRGAAAHVAMELWHDLNHMSGTSEPFGLPEAMRQRDKFRVCYFEPSRFPGKGRQMRMPDALRDALQEALVCPRGISTERLGELLDQSWQLATSKPCYPGPDLPSEEFIRSRGGEA